ncbi:hypothetical protein CNY89_16575, partial [Amaricoccus sp. HAR-UPW-R2A-40]
MSGTWVVIWGLGIGTFLIRFSFLGMIGDRALPDWAMRMLRYVPVAVLPGLVAPIWGLGIGTFLIRFSFLGMIGDRALPDWAMRMLR